MKSATSQGLYQNVARRKAGNDYTKWKQTDKAWNKKQAWTKKEFPKATMFYMKQGGDIVTSVAMLLRHHNVVKVSNIHTFNPWICNKTLKKAKVFNKAAELQFDKISKAYPGFVYKGRKVYSKEKLKDLYKKGYAVIVQVADYHYVAVHSISGKKIRIMDPKYNRTYLSAYSTPKVIYYFKVIDYVDSYKEIPVESIEEMKNVAEDILMSIGEER